MSHGGVTVDLVRNLVGDDALRRDAPDLLRDGLPACAVTTVAGGPGHWRALGIGVPSG